MPLAPAPTAAPRPPVRPAHPCPPAPGAAAEPVRALVEGPARDAVAVGVFPTAVYVAVGADIVSVQTVDALRLPCAVVLPARRAPGPWAGVLRAGHQARVGEGVIDLGGSLVVSAVRWWSPREVRRWVGAPVPATLDGLAGALPALPARLPAPLLDRAAPLLDGRLGDLLGLGEGLTPAGDDVLAGLLVTLHAARRPLPAPAGQALAAAPLLTTTLSATLLRHAQAGRGIPALLDLVDALGAGEDPRPLLDRLLAVGHSSGAALAHGVLLGARWVLATTEPA